MSMPPLSFGLRSFIAVDEGRDQLVRIDPAHPDSEWTAPIGGKCRTLQLLPGGTVLAVTDAGFREINASTGALTREANPYPAGVISAERLYNGHTFLGGINLAPHTGVTFVELDEHDRPTRSVCFAGDYVRRSTLTAEDTILFTCDSHVLEGDWSGRILRTFQAPGFKHAWKAVRTSRGTTLISAGYGAFAVEFSSTGQILRRWECQDHSATLRPHFFGDFAPLPHGGLLVCNWLGHGTDLGDTGYALLEFSHESELIGVWRDARRTSSLQTFVLLA